MKICMGLLYRIRPSIVNDYLYPQTLFSTDSTTVPKYIYFNFPPSCIMSLRLRSPLHHAPDFPFPLSPHTGQAYLRYPCFTPTTLSPHSRLRNVLRSSAHTVSLRFAPGAFLRKRCFATLARLPPHFPSLPIYFFSKFSFPCGSIRSLKSAFIIEGLSVLEEQVSPA